MSFGARWLRWMDGCIFTSSILVIINGSTTKDFKGFKINDVEEMNMLRFVDDTIILAEGDTANLWIMKSILRGFEMMSVDSLPFKFLGVRVGDSARKLSMWRDLILLLKRRLVAWKRVHLNIAGRVCLINFVLNAISIYLFNILNEIRSIQSNFLWNGSDIKRSIHWVCCDTVCKTRETGGLGVKNVEVMNSALLSKWKWRILTDKEGEVVWRGILSSRYDNVKMKVLIGDISIVEKSNSIWWRDILVSDNYVYLLDQHFAGVVYYNVGNGNNVPFCYSS
ncbi:uncharacterized protein LOC131597026 [Vicia villosa]|uniref:uncharacterized protein LOC131597026 n=1 Tax=Vicia villosa TaxID=3911 RepID=UPI00273B2F08|nr:uncharacterized protein LOC131597026 [Vicia villosa]